MMELKRNIEAALGKTKSSLVLKNGFIINVFTQSIEKSDIAICGDTIVGIGKYDGEEEIDCTGLFIAPGFIDSHVHIESSMVIPKNFSELIIKRGVTTVIADPHEICNVLGETGISFMLENSKDSIVDIFYMMPSSVPSTEFEDSGAILGSEELAKFINNNGILGLGEVMDVPSIINGKEDMLKKIELYKGKNIDGHCPGISEKWLNGYLCCKIRTDHECVTYDEAVKKVQRGMYVMLREGSAAKNLRSLLPAVNKDNYHRFLFCTDDRHIEDLIEVGSIDNSIRIAIKDELEPIKAITMATLNAALCYGLKDRGAISPGYKGDLVIFEGINTIKIKTVIKNGIVYEEKNNSEKIEMKTSMNLSYLNKEVFKIKAQSSFVNVIKIIPNSIETRKDRRKVISKDNYVEGVIGDNVLKIASIERHKNSGKKGIGYVEGFGIKGLSIAQTIAHDSHNVIVMGDSDEDMVLAVNKLIDIGGGIVIVSKGKVLEFLSLPIGGLLTSEDPKIVLSKLKSLNGIVKGFGSKKDLDVFLTLAFLALPVIPEVKITSRGLFDFNEFKFIDLFC